MTNKLQIVVGIDFGTTYSGIAWSLTGVTDDIQVISEWPGRGNSIGQDTPGPIKQKLTRAGTSPKVPTTICYEGGRVRWGYELTFQKNVISVFKRLLDEDQQTHSIPDIFSKKLLHERGLSPREAVADYLNKLIGHGREILRRRFGDAVQRLEIQYVLTVPSVWSDKAKDATRLACSAAGIPLSDIYLISEPEAAALHCLRVMQPNIIQNGDIIVICDAGGGTVDVISYCINTVSPLSLEEVTQGTGAACGSILLDTKFLALLTELFGDTEFGQIPCISIQAAMTCWQDTIRPNFMFDEDDDDEFQEIGHLIPLPGVEDKQSIGLEGGFLALDRATIKGIFEYVVKQVVSLVQSQTRDIARSGTKAKAILLVGGFGESEYLYRRLKAACPHTPVMQPADAGAVQRGLDGNRVGKRIARCYYGVYWVKDRITWLIKKNDTISENTPLRHPLKLHVRIHEKRSSYQNLFVCYADTAPDKVTKDAFKVCVMEYDLNAVPTKLFSKKKNSKGIEYYTIDVVVQLIPTSASLLFEMEFNGVPYGSVRAKY
ncbi:actin-like ATPase domain-containing protein [Aspergillus pseudonomiae]|nr:actin-like ATPase domain-containing protein [Aspergillus pseudonomiae]